MERQYLVTERAHFMCPNMHFGMLVELAAEYDGNKIKETSEKMAKAHPFFRSVISYDEDGIRLYYDVKDESMISFVEKESTGTMWEDYRAVSKYEWNPFVNGLLKVYAYNKNGKTPAGSNTDSQPRLRTCRTGRRGICSKRYITFCQHKVIV